jgi:hypothetical protein
MNIPMTGIVLALVFLCSPGAAWADDAILFTAPFGWTAVPGASLPSPAYYGVWIGPTDESSAFRQNINILQGAATKSIAATAAENVQEITASGDVTDLKQGANAQCASSWLISFAATQYGYNLLFEQVFTIAGGTLYVATYTREVSEPESRAAKRAIDAMCPASNA